MEYPPLPPKLAASTSAEAANRLHSLAIWILRRVRAADRDTGLSPERLSLLSVLVFAGPRTLSQLADAEMVSRPAITRIVHSLEEAGLVRREAVARDRRLVLLHATPSGRSLMDRGRRRRVAMLAETLGALDEAELEQVQRVTDILAKLELGAPGSLATRATQTASRRAVDDGR